MVEEPDGTDRRDAGPTGSGDSPDGASNGDGVEMGSVEEQSTTPEDAGAKSEDESDVGGKWLSDYPAEDVQARVVLAGFLLAGLALVALLVPLRGGTTDFVFVGGVVLSGAVAITLGHRRPNVIGPRLGGATSGLGAGGVLLFAGYALNQGVYATVPVPVFPNSVSLTGVAVVAATGTIVAAAIDHVGMDGAGLRRRVVLFATASGVGVVGLLAFHLWSLALAIPAVLLLEAVYLVHLVVISQFGMAAGTVTVAVGYLVLSGRDVDFIDVRWPSIPDVAWTVVGLLGLFATLLAISQLLAAGGVDTAGHGTTERATENPEILLVLIPAAILVIGPCEELLYRNVIQKSLYDGFSRTGAIVVASVVFAGVHALAYGTAGIGAILASLGVIFGLSLVLGVIYERTENLVVPALVHGLYNAFLFASLYFTYA